MMKGCSKVSSKLFSRLIKPSSLSLSYIAEVLQPLKHICGLSWTQYSSSTCLSHCGAQTWRQNTRQGPKRAEQGEESAPSAAHTTGEEPQDIGVSGLPAHMACLWTAFIPPLPPGPSQQSWSQSVCPSACIHMGGFKVFRSWGPYAAFTTSNKYPGNHPAERNPWSL